MIHNWFQVSSATLLMDEFTIFYTFSFIVLFNVYASISRWFLNLSGHHLQRTLNRPWIKRLTLKLVSDLNAHQNSCKAFEGSRQPIRQTSRIIYCRHAFISQSKDHRAVAAQHFKVFYDNWKLVNKYIYRYTNYTHIQWTVHTERLQFTSIFITTNSYTYTHICVR